MRLSLKERLIAWLEKNPGFHANGDLQRLVMEKTTYTPRTTARRLEELVNEGKIIVQYKKGHAFYSKRIQDPVAWFDSLE